VIFYKEYFAFLIFLCGLCASARVNLSDPEIQLLYYPRITEYIPVFCPSDQPSAVQITNTIHGICPFGASECCSNSFLMNLSSPIEFSPLHFILDTVLAEKWLLFD
jgi:hypothetical protein